VIRVDPRLVYPRWSARIRGSCTRRDPRRSAARVPEAIRDDPRLVYPRRSARILGSGTPAWSATIRGSGTRC